MKKLIAKYFTLLACVFTLGACSGKLFGKSDPLATESEAVRKGIPPQGAPKPLPPPVDKYALYIDGQENLVFRENVEQEIVFSARSIFANSKFKLEITNLDEFPGATIEVTEGDKALGQQAKVKFKWTPPLGITVGDISPFTLQTRVATTNLEEAYTVDRDFVIFVYRERFITPEIVEVAKLKTPVREGTSNTFTINVKDAETKNLPGAKPSLYFFSNNVGIDAASLMKIMSVKLIDPINSIWQFQVKVDATNIELTSSNGSARFEAVALSYTGTRSQSAFGDFEIWTSIMQPITTWADTDLVEFKIGQENRFQFIVFDPKTEGKVSTTFTTACNSLPNAPSCSCKSLYATSMKTTTVSSCEIIWNVPVNYPGGSSIIFEFVGKNEALNPKDVVGTSTTPTFSNANFKKTIKFVN